ncbi:MAG: cytochrome c [Deltaproteobacteria bacterium]|nr:cytochrome c [Deltaproteobacteria bacterium]
MQALKMVLFSLAVMGFFTWFSNYIPQIESHPPKKISLDSKLTEDEMIGAGETVYNTKGTCGICHAIGRKGNRGPDLGGIAERAKTRKPGLDATGYLLESLLAPAAYLVEKYGPLMPPMGNALSPGEVWVTVAYLQSLGGEVSITPAQIRAAYKLHGIPLSGGTGSAAGGTAAAEQAAPAPAPVVDLGPAPQLGDAEAGKKVYLEVCLACHGPDPANDGPIGPKIQGASAELLLYRVVAGAYPKGHKPLRPTKLMPPMPNLKDKVGDLAAFLK